MKKTTKTVKTPKDSKAKKSTKKQQKPVSFIEAIHNMLNLDLVSKESQESNKSLQDTPNDESNSLYIETTPESPDEPEIIIEVDLDPTFEVEVETLPDPNKMEAEIEVPTTFKEKHKESPVLEAINRETFDDIVEPEVKEEKPKEVIKPIEYKKSVSTYKQRLEAIKARLNRK